ncbi:ribonuclease PH, partial [bacterium]|nr:ribonuclease PH [bacterium]
MNTVSAISIGLKGGEILTDLDYQEDSGCEADTNFVVTGDGKIVEFQGTAEQAPFSAETVQLLTQSALRATATLHAVQLETLRKAGVSTR